MHLLPRASSMAETFIETGRLRLRTWRDEDRAPFAAMNADSAVMRFFPSILSKGESDAMVDRIAGRIETLGYGLFAVERRADGTFLGFTGFSTAPARTPVEGEVEIGWRLAKSSWRQGFAYEAASACMEWFWRATDFPRFVSFTARTNEPSWRLMRKLGLVHRPDLDFDHPDVPPGNPLRPHVVYVMERPFDG